MSINSVSSSSAGIQKQSAALDRAASRMVRATLAERPSVAPAASGVTPAEAPPELAQATVDLMVSKRMFTAAVRMAQTVNEGITEALKVGGYQDAA